MGFFPENIPSATIDIMVPVLPRSFYSDSEWIAILTKGITQEGEYQVTIDRPVESPYAEILRAMKQGKYMCNAKYYRAHEVGYPESEILTIKTFTSLGGKQFDMIEALDPEHTKKERYWYMHIFAPQLVKDGEVKTFDS